MGKKKQKINPSEEVIQASSTEPTQTKAEDGDEMFSGFKFPDTPDHIIPALVTKRTQDAVRARASNVKPPLPVPETRHSVRRSPTAGMGLFAAASLKTGDLIFSERPLIVTITEHGNKSEEQLEQCLGVLWARLPQHQAMTWLNLYSPDDSPTGNRQLSTLVSLNGWGFDPYPGAPYHIGIFPTYARANHRCGPNAQAHFNHDTWSIELRAAKAIKAGEEIFVSYVNVLDPRATRMQALQKSYEFKCVCSFCSEPDSQKRAASDGRRSTIRSWQSAGTPTHVTIPSSTITHPILQSYHEWRYTTAFLQNPPTKLITSCLSGIITCTQESLEPFSWPHLLVLYRIYGILSDQKNFSKWRALFRDTFCVNVGVTEEWDRATKEVENPQLYKEWAYWQRATELREELQRAIDQSLSLPDVEQIHRRWEKTLL